MKFKLTQALVTRYAKLAALANLIDKWLDEHRPLVRQALESGHCPDRGPYLLELTPSKARIDWKMRWRVQFALYLEAEGKSAEQIGSILDACETRIEAAPRESGPPRIEKKVNPNFRREVAIKLPY